MIYDVRQSTTYVYASPVAHARHVLRQVPINRDGQRVHVAAVQIDPEPQHRREGRAQVNVAFAVLGFKILLDITTLGFLDDMQRSAVRKDMLVDFEAQGFPRALAPR